MDDDATAMKLGEDELREIALYAASCARQVLSLFESSHPADHRPREAIEGAEAFGLGGRRTALLRSQAWAAHAAARDTQDPAAADAARAASLAAAAAYLHPKATAHQVRHILGAAAHQARALESAAGDDKTVGNEQLRWALKHAPPAVRDVLRRMPNVPAGRGRMGDFLRELDTGLRR
ncbi:putative immunity protein [Bosea sp. 2KB_26]|uniref:putative immunity protein n=1 Tax=Bosea sp. 2KB_26 TaxID=3237475 RepID=UPI003F8F3E56